MSQGKRRAITDVAPIISELMTLLKPNTSNATVCGSVRRNEESIGDVDIVVCPLDARAYLDMMDECLNLGYYGKGKNAGGRETWGANKRLIAYKGINFDVIIADPDQLGFKIWQSTGPQMANTAMMALLKEKVSPVRSRDGYLWHVKYDRKHPKYEKALGYARLAKLHVPDEETFFKLVGLPYCHPQWRSEAYYQKYLWVNGQPSRELILEHYIEESRPVIQQSMFK